jgi:hypothetical protein
VLITLIPTIAAAQERPPAVDHERRPPAAAVDAPQEEQALTQDIARMRTLLQQMEMNLTFVTTMQNPLKHQFELEMDMWRVVLDDMERRMQSLRGGGQKK